MKSAATRIMVSLLCLASGLAGGWLVRQSADRSAVVAKESSPRPVPAQRILWSRRAASPADAPLKEEPTKSMVPGTRASDYRLAARIAALSPEQARRHLADKFTARNVWLIELLWFRAASADPATMMAQREVPAADPESGEIDETGELTEVLRGIFRAWVRRDPAAALEAAQATPQRLEVFVEEWAAHDPAAAARAVESGQIPPAHLDTILSSWSRRAPGAALAWVHSIHDLRIMETIGHNAAATYAPSDPGNALAEWRGMMRASLLQSRVASDPAAALPEIAALAWGRPWTREGARYNGFDDHLRNAVDTVVALSPEMAAQFVAGLPQERLTPFLARGIANALDSSRPGTGTAWAKTLTDPALRETALPADEQ